MDSADVLGRAERAFSVILSRLKFPLKKPKLSDRDIDRILMHLESISKWNKQEHNYVETKFDFPQRIYVAKVVCNKSCGTVGLVVDGESQECANCGRFMFRTETRAYVLEPEE